MSYRVHFLDAKEDKRWHSKDVTTILDARELCDELCSDKRLAETGTDRVCLVEDEIGRVREFFVTFMQDPDNAPYYSHRTCEPIGVAAAKRNAWMLEPVDILGYFEVG